MRRKTSAIPEILTVKAEKQVYTIDKRQKIWTFALDADGFTFPILLGSTFDGYDENVLRFVGSTAIPVSAGTTRVTVHWHGMSGDFVVHVR